ncbi:uncharacterized protein SCHCODRAFT_01149713 [Schizophyllum commune H4-8]|uniref:Expressed protein n=1 Tax=Schizophyllum commune (strain H4-8 / FGSC 9210) TaxID=578458 RepID=D8Q2G7_SCHCM|nr:uncharacterized protein SCHCODRAFT_01149713 [Schizophyllum commune H4-8]KAI5895874.1 hypothetical protein SCHCODRAFT_01149713 [Schizophyllum commune H4-8]
MITLNIDGLSAPTQAGVVGAQASSAQIPVDPQLEDIWKSTQSGSASDKRSGLQRPSGKENHGAGTSAPMAVSHVGASKDDMAMDVCGSDSDVEIVDSVQAAQKRRRALEDLSDNGRRRNPGRRAAPRVRGRYVEPPMDG